MGNLRRPSAAVSLLALIAALGLVACGGRPGGSGGGGGSGDDDDSSVPTDDDDTVGPCDDGDTQCDGWQFYSCEDSGWTVAAECLPPNPICDDDLGCLACTPDQRSCDGNAVVQCNGDGLATSWIEDCPADAPCVGGQCLDACATAAAQFSYLGCEFFATSAANPLDPIFDNDFGVVLANPAGSAGVASVTVRRGSSVVATANVSPGQTEALELPMVNELQDTVESSIVPGGAYEIESSQPIAAYQYNPLHFQISITNSFSNDASLLLPAHTFTGNYMVASMPSFGVGQGSPVEVWSGFLPGFFSVVGTEAGTDVTLHFTGETAAGNPGPQSAGDSETITIGRGDVVQVLGWAPNAETASASACTQAGWTTTTGFDVLGTQWTYCLGEGTDLTGTVIEADAPVGVFAGHLCSFVPYDAWACDHLEETMFPTETWGDRAVMTAPRFPGGGGVASTKYRVLALNDGTQVSFDPAVAGTSTLGAGDFVEFDSNQDFVVEGTGPIFVTQIMLGQDALGATIGDPAMGSGIPWIQVRADYDFQTPSTYTENFLNVVSLTSTDITLDGSPVTGWEPVGSTGFSVARVPLNAGSHRIASNDGSRFGITTYGYAAYTSYLYPGGLNLGR